MGGLSSPRAFGTRAGAGAGLDIIHRVLVLWFHHSPVLHLAFFAFLLPLLCTLPFLQPRIFPAPWGCTMGCGKQQGMCVEGERLDLLVPPTLTPGDEAPPGCDRGDTT